MPSNQHPKIREEDGSLFLNFGDYGEKVELAAFCADGSRVLTVHEVSVARIWNVDTGELVGEIRPTSPLDGKSEGPTTYGFQTFIESVALNTTGELALLGLNDGTAGVFSVTEGKRLCTLYAPTRQPATKWELIRAVCYSPDGSLVAVGFYGGSVGVWRTADALPVAFLSPTESSHWDTHKNGPRPSLISSVAVSHDNRYIFGGNTDMTASIWELTTGECVFHSVEHMEEILRFYIDDSLLLWATSGGTVWKRTLDHDFIRVLTTQENWHEAAFAPDGTELLVKTSSGQVKRWELHGEETVLSQVEAGGWSDRARMLGYVQDKSVMYYPLTKDCLAIASSDSLAKLQRDTQLVNAILSPQGDLLATEGWGHTVELWSVPSGERVSTSPLYKGISDFSFSPDGSLMAIAEMWHISEGGRYPIHICRLPDCHSVGSLIGHDHHIFGLGFAPDNSWLVSTSLDRTVRMWDLQDDSYQQTLQVAVPDLDMYTLRVLSNGNILIFRSQHVEIWDAQFRRLAVLSVGHSYPRIWTLSADEEYLFIARDMQQVDVWNLKKGTRTNFHPTQIIRPETFPPYVPGSSYPMARGYLWRGYGGPYIHTSDGPRGWVTPLTISGKGNEVVVPFNSLAASFTLEPATQLHHTMPYEGRMKAGIVTPEKMLVVSEDGKIQQIDID